MKLFTPGPVEVPKEVLEACSKKLIHHRGEDFHYLFDSVVSKLSRIAKLKGFVALIPGCGTAAVDAAAWSLASPRDRVLVLARGEFGYRLIDTFRRRGAEVTVVEAPFGNAEPLEEVLGLVENGRFDIVALVHCETSAGTKYPYLKEIAKACRSLGSKLLIDAVSSFAGEELDMSWGIDVVATASHKALASIPGVAIVLVSDEVSREIIEKPRSVPPSLDLAKYVEFNAKSETPFTPSITAIYALHAALERIERIGIDRYIEMHREKAQYLYDRAKELNLEPVPKDRNARSNTVVALQTDVSAIRIKKELKARGFIVSTGMGKHRDSVIRIGTMGNVSLEDLERLVIALKEVLEALRGSN